MSSVVSPRGFLSWIRWAIVGTDGIPTDGNGILGIYFTSFGNLIAIDIFGEEIPTLLRSRLREQFSQLKNLSSKVLKLGLVGFNLLQLSAMIDW